MNTGPLLTTGTTTIAAVATAPGRAGIGVIRVSGANLQEMARVLTGAVPEPRHATFVRFLAENPAEVLDEGLILYFPAPHSFTGEDVIELHGHGGPVVMQMLLGRCLDLGARLAQPGEFTRRAFLNGKLDLAQAEAVADLIDAATASAAKSAVRSLSGEFSRRIRALLDELIALRTLTEATLDFPEEEVDFLQTYNARERLRRLVGLLEKIRATARQGQRLQSGLRVVLVGEPNVGKSSLLNCLAGDDLAIVTPVAGTTRDAVRTTIQINGIPVYVIDTAGLRDTDDEVEKIGIERTWREIELADVLIILQEAASFKDIPSLADFAAHLPAGLPRILVRNKIDLTDETPGLTREEQQTVIALSAKTGAGVELLHEELLKLAGGQPSEDAFIARERHLRALERASNHIEAADRVLPQLEIFADELRLAQAALAEITGEFSADDLLGEIFSQFCIGK